MTIKMQVVLFENEPAAIARLLDALAATVRASGAQVELHVGDCSASPLLAEEALDAWKHDLGPEKRAYARYTFFGANVGFGQGHNRLWREASSADSLLIVNPDALPAFHLLDRLAGTAAANPAWGAIEARQIPIEHPKRFDPVTWETEWVSGACCLIDGAAFDAVGGFDELFFAYAEDVDLSWRLRAAGRRLYTCPETFVFHAKRLKDGRPVMSAAERYHGPLSLMLLRAKYGREELNERVLTMLRADRRPENERMLADYERLRQRLTSTSVEQRAVARFTPNGDLADLRWTYPLPNQLITVS